MKAIAVPLKKNNKKIIIKATFKKALDFGSHIKKLSPEEIC